MNLEKSLSSRTEKETCSGSLNKYWFVWFWSCRAKSIMSILMPGCHFHPYMFFIMASKMPGKNAHLTATHPGDKI